MKQRKDSRNCSSLVCNYADHPNQDQKPSVHILVKQGSKVGRLVYGKRIPLRERKLLEKLVQTRVLYDEVRKQILRSNNLQIKKQKYSNREENDESDNTTLQKVIELVDKGQVRPSEIMSTSCSCCSCNSNLARPYKRYSKYDRQTTSSSSAIYRDKKNEKHPDHQPRKIRFHNARSDPCMCALNKLRDLKNKASKVLLKKFESKEKSYEVPEAQIVVKTNKIKKILCACKASKLTRNSLEKLKHAKTQLVEKISSSASMLQNNFRIKKDSIMLYRDNLKKKRAMKKRECKPSYCLQDEPCHDLVQAEEIKKNIYQRPHPEMLSTPITIRAIPRNQKNTVSADQKVKRDVRPSIKTPKKSKANHVLCECKPTTKSISSGTNVSGTNLPPAEPVNIRTRHPITSSLRKYSIDSTNRDSSKSNSGRFETRSSRKSHDAQKDYSGPERDEETEISRKEAVRISSSFRFEIEFYKQKYPMIADGEVLAKVKKKRQGRDRKIEKEERRREPFEYEQLSPQIPTKGASPSSEWIPLQDAHRHTEDKKLRKYSAKSTVYKSSETGKFKRTKCECNSKSKVKCKCDLKPNPIVCKCKIKSKQTECKCVRKSMSTQTKKLSQSKTTYVLPPISSMPEHYDRPRGCDSSVCKRRHKRHQIRSKYHSKEISTIEVPKRSVLTITSPSDTQLSEFTHQNPRGIKQIKQESLKRSEVGKSKTSNDSFVTTNRSAVSIGSSFSCSIEFFRYKSEPEDYSYIDNPKKNNKKSYEKPMEYISKQRKRDHGIKLHKSRTQHKAPETNNREIVYTPKDSFLRKCLCTLRLSKRRESEPLRDKSANSDLGYKIKPLRVHKNTQSMTSNRTYTRFKGPRPCSPPDTSAPYEHYNKHPVCKHNCSHKHINRYQNKPPIKQKGIFMGSAMQKCLCTLKFHKSGHCMTMRESDKVPDMGTEIPDDKIMRRRRFGTQLCEPNEYCPEMARDERKKITGDKLASNRAKSKTKSTMSINKVDVKTNTSKRDKHSHYVPEKDFIDSRDEDEYDDYKSRYNAVRLSSSFKFNIDFFKDKSLPIDPSSMYKQREFTGRRIHSAPKKHNAPYRSNGTCKNDTQRDNMKNTVSRRNNGTFRDDRDELNRDKEPKFIGKTASVGVVLKKCFCSLKLHKKGKAQIQNEMITQSTITPTKMMKCYDTPYNKFSGSRDIDSHKYAKLQKGTDKRIGPERLHYRNKSIPRSSKSSSKSKKIQSTITPKYTPLIKEEPYKRNKKVVRLGSHVNFDVEFYKDKGNTDVNGYQQMEIQSPTSTRYKDYQLNYFNSEAFQIPTGPFERNLFDYNVHENKLNDATYNTEDCLHSECLQKQCEQRSKNNEKSVQSFSNFDEKYFSTVNSVSSRNTQINYTYQNYKKFNIF